VLEQYLWSSFLVRWFWLILFSLAILLQYRLWFGEPSLPQVWNLKDQIEEQKRHNQVLLERNTQLEAEVRDLKQGLSALEERARSEMGMIVKGETFYQVVKPLPPAGKVNE
jgi:cell division protein FtsB